MSLASIIAGGLSGILAPVRDIVDELHVSDEERGALLAAIQESESHVLQARTQVLTAVALHGNWLQRSWRPITMLVFLGLAVADSFGALSSPLAPEAWQLLKIGLGGYVAGRSLEKTVASLKGG